MSDKNFSIKSGLIISSLTGNGLLKSDASGNISNISGSSSQYVKADGSLDSNVYHPARYSFVNINAATLTASSSSHKYKMLVVNNTTSPYTTVITLPTDANDSGWAVGDWFEVSCETTGANNSVVSFTNDPSGVVSVIYNPDGPSLKLRTYRSHAYVEKINSNTWLLQGDLVI